MFCKNKMSREDRQKWKLKMYNYWEDNLEERLAGVKAAKEKLEEQMSRDVEYCRQEEKKKNTILFLLMIIWNGGANGK